MSAPSTNQPAPTGTFANLALAQQLLDAFDQLQGVHPGYRPAHAKGLMCEGAFTPSAEAAKLTRAPHASRSSTPVTVRYSNSTGIPNIPDNDPAHPSPRGIGIRFHLDEHAHTDMVGHSYDGFLSLLGQLPFRLTAEQAGWVLNCQAHDIPALIHARLLKPLGNPSANGTKHFATADLLETAKDRS